MKKIFTFVLGAFMALSASASTIFVEFNEDQVTFEKGYNEVFDWDSEGFVNEYFWDFQGHIDGAYEVRVFYTSKVEELEGTYDVGDLQSLTELKDLHQNRTIWFESGTVTITKGQGDDDNLYVKCEIVGRDAQDYTTQDYVINLTYSPKAAAVEMTGVATKAIKTIENGMIVIEHNGVRRNVIGQVVR